MKHNQHEIQTPILGYMPAHIFGQQQRARRHRRQDVAGQLGGGEGKKYDWKQQPDNEKNRQRITRPENFPLFGPPDANTLEQSRDHKYRPWNEAKQNHRQVIPEWFRVMIEIATEARQIVLQNKHPEEFRISELDRNVPWKCNHAKQADAGNPKSS